MQELLLSTSGFQVFLIIAGLIVGVVVLANVYSSIIEHSGVKDKDGCGWPIFLVAIAIVIGILMNLSKCEGSGNHRSTPDWQYKHTDRIK